MQATQVLRGIPEGRTLILGRAYTNQPTSATAPWVAFPGNYDPVGIVGNLWNTRSPTQGPLRMLHLPPAESAGNHANLTLQLHTEGCAHLRLATLQEGKDI